MVCPSYLWTVTNLYNLLALLSIAADIFKDKHLLNKSSSHQDSPAMECQQAEVWNTFYKRKSDQKDKIVDKVITLHGKAIFKCMLIHICIFILTIYHLLYDIFFFLRLLEDA